jgi:hypothetical protein
MSSQHYQIHISINISPYKHGAYLASNEVAISKSSWCPCRSYTRRLCTASLKASPTFATAGRVAGDYKQQTYRCQSSGETMTSHNKHNNKIYLNLLDMSIIHGNSMIVNVQTCQQSPKERLDIADCGTSCSLHGSQNLQATTQHHPLKYNCKKL